MATNTDLGFADDVPDKELERMYGKKTNEELAREYDDCVQWRDWFTCELINMEFDRRRRVPKKISKH